MKRSAATYYAVSITGAALCITLLASFVHSSNVTYQCRCCRDPDRKAKWDAQNLASVYDAVVYAGVDFGESRTPREIAERLAMGVPGAAGTEFYETQFKVPLDGERLDRAMAHIDENFKFIRE